MKNKRVKRLVKGLALFSVGALLFFSVGADAKALSSDQVSLSEAVPGAGLVNTVNSNLYVRSGPGTQYSVLTSLPSHTNVMVVGRPEDQVNGFYRVLYDEGNSYGYVSAQYFLEQPVPFYFTANPDPGHTLNFREDGDLGSNVTILANIPYGRAFPGYLSHLYLNNEYWNWGLYARWEGYEYELLTIFHTY